MSSAVEDVFRYESPHVLAALLRRHGDLADCEDSTQEAMEAAARQWPRDGMPDNPRAWLVRVASRRLIDRLRADASRSAREAAVAAAEPGDILVAPAVDAAEPEPGDDTLQLLLLCCHPALTRPSQVALTLRSVGGLTPAQVAAAFLVPERTMIQRLTRARSTLRNVRARFDLPEASALPERVAAVLDVLHLIFNEGYTRSSGDRLVDASLTGEALRLTRQLAGHLPEHDEVAGALALMLLTQARATARTDDNGDLIPLAEQDRRRWDRALITEGVRLLEDVLPRGHVGRFQLQAAIAAVHAEATTYEETDWLQIAVLYEMLARVAPSSAVTLNRAVAVGMAYGPEAGIGLVDELLLDPGMQRHHRTYAVRAHLRELSGDGSGALADYRRAARLTASQPEQRYLNARAARLAGNGTRTS